MGREITVYITADENRILSGDPLVLLVKDIEEQRALVFELSKALKAEAVQLKNGDYMIIQDV